jgi:hypothetical protein
MDHISKFPGKKTGSSSTILWVAIGATIYGAMAFYRTHSEEQKYYAAHAEQKTQILRIPGELMQVERDITHEQDELSRIQAEIRRRLGQK